MPDEKIVRRRQEVLDADVKRPSASVNAIVDEAGNGQNVRSAIEDQMGGRIPCDRVSPNKLDSFLQGSKSVATRRNWIRHRWCR